MCGLCDGYQRRKLNRQAEFKFRACLLRSLSHKHPCKRHEYVSSPPSPSYGVNSWLPSLERKREKATRNNSTIFHKNDNKEEESGEP